MSDNPTNTNPEMPDTKKKSGQKKRLEKCQEWQKKLESAYMPLRDKRQKALKYLNADPSIVPILENRAKITTTDMQDAIDMAKPDILETICGTDEPLKLDPDAAKWVEQVKKLQVLGNVNIKRKNPWFRICSDFLDDSMSLKFGCIKYAAVEKKEEIEKTYKALEDIELQTLLMKEGASLVSDGIDEESDGVRKTVIKYTLIDEYVRLNAVPAERIKFPLDTRSFDNCPICIEEVRLYEDEFIKEYGQKFFDKVKKVKEGLDSAKPDPVYTDRFKHLGGLDYIYSKKDEKYIAYEAYFPWDGEPWVLIFSADEVHTDDKNKYRKPPYRGGSAFLVAHALIGKDYVDCVKNIQEERTYMKRQIFDVVSRATARRNFVNIEGAGLSIKDYENNSAMDALIRCTGRLEGNILPEKHEPLSPEVIAFWEMMNVEKDAHIPTPRAYSGLEGAKDERTYRGKQLKVNQASKKLLLMMRGYMEEVFGPLFQDVLDCIARFMTKKTVVRYLNEDYEISPEDVICKYALVVNVGLGSHDKQDLIVKLQQAIQLGMQMMQIGVVTPQNLAYMYGEMVKAMGFLNTTDFVTDPKIKEVVMQFIQTVLQMLQHFAEIPQLTPEIHQIGGQIAQMAEQIIMAMGIKPQKSEGGPNVEGTQPGQDTAALPTNPANAMNPQTQITGGGFYA